MTSSIVLELCIVSNRVSMLYVMMSNFLDDDGKYKVFQPMWSFGDPSSRKCVAYRLAEFKGIAALTRLLYNFKITLADNHAEPEMMSTFTISPSIDILVRFEKI